MALANCSNTNSLSFQIINLKLPYATNCTDKELKEASVYTQSGCRQECSTQHNVDKCGCKPAFSKG